MNHFFLLIITLSCQLTFPQKQTKGLRGDSEAIIEAKAMVETLGGIKIWKQLKSLHFVHEWHPANRVDTYIENEILDLTAPKSWVERKSEISHAIRAYSPEGKYWNLENGVFTYGSTQIWEAAMKRAPFNFYHLIRAIAANDPFYEIRFGKSNIPTGKQLNFYDPVGHLRGWIIINAKKEPIAKATPEYTYTLGPLKRFGNILIPNWGVYDTGYTRYEMISLIGSNQTPEASLFLPPLDIKKTN